MADSEKTVVEVSKTTVQRIKEIKKKSGMNVGALADRGLDFFCTAVKRGEVVIQNGKVIRVGELAPAA